MTCFAIMLFIAGIVLMAVPNLVYGLTQGWKNDHSAEPSDLYKIVTRVEGAALAAVGIFLFFR